MRQSAGLRIKHPSAAYSRYILALLLFGSNGIIADSIHLAGCQIILLRTFLGSLQLLLIGIGTHAFKGIAHHRRDIHFIVLSGVCMGISWMFQYEAYQRIGVSITSLLYCLGPVLVVLSAQIVFKESITFRKALCLAAVATGAALTGSTSLRGGTGITGIICALMCALAYVGIILFNKKSAAVHGLANAAVQLTSGFITALLYNVFRWLSGSTSLLCLDSRECLPVLILGLLNTGIGCWLYFSGISVIPAQTVAVCDYIEPLSAVILAALILHEAMTALQIAGAALIIGGTVAWNILG